MEELTRAAEPLPRQPRLVPERRQRHGDHDHYTQRGEVPAADSVEGPPPRLSPPPGARARPLAPGEAPPSTSESQRWRAAPPVPRVPPARVRINAEAEPPRVQEVEVESVEPPSAPTVLDVAVVAEATLVAESEVEDENQPGRRVEGRRREGVQG